MQNITIRTEYITLGQFLKLADCIDTGGQAKMFLEEHHIEINGVEDRRRGRKLRHDDVVRIQGFGQYRIVYQG